MLFTFDKANKRKRKKSETAKVSPATASYIIFPSTFPHRKREKKVSFYNIQQTENDIFTFTLKYHSEKKFGITFHHISKSIDF